MPRYTGRQQQKQKQKNMHGEDDRNGEDGHPQNDHTMATAVDSGDTADGDVVLQEGQRWYVVSMKWYARYRRHTMQKGSSVGGEEVVHEEEECTVRQTRSMKQRAHQMHGARSKRGGPSEEEKQRTANGSGGGERVHQVGLIDNSDIVQTVIRQPGAPDAIVEGNASAEKMVVTAVVLREGLEEGVDFVTVSEDIFLNRLYEQYGLRHAQSGQGNGESNGSAIGNELYQIIERRVIVDGDTSHRMLRIELFPFVLNVAMAVQDSSIEHEHEEQHLHGVALDSLVRADTHHQIVISRKATLGHLKRLVCSTFTVQANRAMRIWTTMEDTLVLVSEDCDENGAAQENRHTDDNSGLMGDNVAVEDALIYDKQHIVVEMDHKSNRGEGRQWFLDTVIESQKCIDTKDKTNPPPLPPSPSSTDSDSCTPSREESDSTSTSSIVTRRKRRKLNEALEAEGSNGNSAPSTSTAASSNTGSYLEGVCGLQNLGNTCFMNSALQCLSNTPRLSEYFVSGRFRDHININNPLGMQGKLGYEYGDLMTELWSGGRRSTAPLSFKRSLGQFAPQFSGHKQQDAQELLAFLLDGLHEDVNRVIEKPYVEQNESAGRPDAIVAQEAWMHHLRRNKSVVVDLFQGQLKSTLVCPECHNVSIKFDPFMYLSVPIPNSRTLAKIDIVAKFPAPTINALEQMDEDVAQQVMTKRPVKYSLEIDSGSTIGVLARKYGHLFGKDPRHMVFMDLTGCRVHSVLESDDLVESISPTTNTILCFQEPPFTPYNIIHVVQRLKLDVHPSQARREAYPVEELYQLTGIPFSLFLPGSEETNEAFLTGKRLYLLVLVHVRRLCAKTYQSSPPDSLFTLSYSDFTGKACKPEKCDKRICYGCPIPCDDTRIYDLEDLDTISLTWNNPAVLNRNECMKVVIDPSVKVLRQKRERGTKLEDCLHSFGDVEQLSVNDPWFCPHCRELRRAYKSFECWSLPDVLVVHLKRFIFDRRRRQKNNTMVNFPMELDMAPYMVQRPDHPVMYRLYAVSNHAGSLRSGHYTAFAFNHREKQWYLYDDSTAIHISHGELEEQIVTNMAYVLFYERVYEEGSISVSPVSSPVAERGTTTDGNSNGSQRIEPDSRNGVTRTRPTIRLIKPVIRS